MFRPGRALVLAAVSTAVLAGCTAGGHSGTRDPMDGPESSAPALTGRLATPTLSWRRCPELDGGVDPDRPGLRCARLSVPLDYDEPGGRSISLAVSRVSRGSGRPVLVSNPGGPGATGLYNTIGVDGATGGRLGRTFDLVGLDTRGVNLSSPVSCGLSDDLVASATGGAAPTTSGEDARTARLTAAACERGIDREALDATTTVNTARDLEMLRRALAVDSLSIVGTSYGAELATTFASMFPDATAGVVLDSPSDPTRPWAEARTAAAAISEERFDEVARQIAARDSRFHLGTTAGEVRDRYLGLVRVLERAPRRVAGEVVDAATLQEARLVPALEDSGAVEAFALTVQHLVRAPGALTEDELVRALGEGQAGGSTTVNGQSLEQQVSANLAVRCADDPWPTDPASYAEAVEEQARRYPTTRGRYARITPCAFWPSLTREARPRIDDRGWSGTPNVLVLHHRTDVLSDPVGVGRLVEALGSRATTLERPGESHVLLGDDRCATDAVVDWLTGATDDPGCGSDR